MRDAPEADAFKLPAEAVALVRFAGLVLDLHACTLARDSGEAIPLTRGEFALLRVFVTRPGRVVNRDALLDSLAHRRFEPFDRSVDVLIGRLRRKIEPDPKQPRLIVTVAGEGYRFDGLAKTPPFAGAHSARGAARRIEERAEPSTKVGSEQRYSPKPAAVGAAPAPPAAPAATDQAKPHAASARGGVVALAAALLFATAIGWALFSGPTTRSQPAHLSIVVLPFADLTDDPAQDHFADGLTDSLTTELSRMGGSFVIARNTAATYKGKNVDAKEIGKELGVRYLLEGSVQREGARVRVNAQMVDAESGAHLWADRFDEDAESAFKLQDEVVTRLARGLQVALIEAEAENGARSKNPDAIDLTMRGSDLLLRSLSQPKEEMRKVNPGARSLFERALEIDPNDADALAGNAATYLRDFAFGWGDSGIDYEAKVLEQANRAIALDPNKTNAYQVKADYLSLSGRPSAALNVANAGLAINPTWVSLYAPRASAENDLGRFEQAKADAERAIRLGPREPFLGAFLLVLGDAELNLGHFDAAIDAYRKALVAGQRRFFVYAHLAAAYGEAGKMDEATAALAEARRLNPDLTVKRMIEHAPNFPALFEGARKAGLPEQ